MILNLEFCHLHNTMNSAASKNINMELLGAKAIHIDEICCILPAWDQEAKPSRA
jgi:hypothetical protein